MTGKERVRRAVLFQCPDGTPEIYPNPGEAVGHLSERIKAMCEAFVEFGNLNA
ncbi:MAG: hypothetical protein GXO71_01215 [Caldiserica bacterium]|nr:hypothetical protein [Caldisericota bacterium]